MNTKLTPGVVLLAIALGTVIGPATTLAHVSSGNLQDASYWWEIAASTLGSFATTVLTITGLVAAALGLPILKGSSDAGPTP